MEFPYKPQPMFNFLDPRLLPQVICKSPSTDNYEAENLINPNEAIKARGFLAYSVIKPPVEIEFQFICPIHTAYISLNTTIGNQKCSGIEIFAKTPDSHYTSIAKAVYDKPGLVVCNSRLFTKENPPPLLDDNKALFFFKSNTFRSYTNASAIKIVIFRTERFTVPCLGSVQIIGSPSRTCFKTTVETIEKLMATKSVINSEESCNNAADDNKWTIPEDFLDALTCETMAIPMTLPSGKTVDRDTLEKHIANEASFGRKPCDPFTGLKFTESRKPVFNAALKSRIDMFLMRNSSNPMTYGLKRTLGTSDLYCKKVKLDNNEMKCGKCSDMNVLYSIPCGHYFCKNCLINSEISKCDLCHKDFKKSDVQRFYL